MVSAIDCAPGGMNAALYAETQAASKLKRIDGEVRADLQQAIAQAGGANVTPQLYYAVGPDGQRYAIGGSVSTSQVVDADRISSLGLAPEKPKTPEAFTPQGSLADLQPPSLLSPQAFAEGFSEDSAALAELRRADAGVRNHEGLHFRAAGGIASGLPEYDFVKGPDGQYYAVGGQVDVQTTSTSDPEKARRDANTFAHAATASSDASAQDNQAARGALARAAEAYGLRADAPRNEALRGLIGLDIAA